MLRRFLVRVKNLAIDTPVLHSLFVKPYLNGKARSFNGSSDYWDKRYARGGISGPGSRGPLAQYKADFLNAFVTEHEIGTVVELGSGDGHQLALLELPSYLGVDVSPQAIALCQEHHGADPTKQFVLLANYQAEESFDLALSLDVIFHLVEDDVFEAYMAKLFGSASRFVIVYASDRDEQDPGQEPHVRHRRYSDWIRHHAPDWSLRSRHDNPHSNARDLKVGTFAQFAVFERAE